ncbi:hypothetical protein Y032_0117g681 [Ancylostoma ceylanicum]|uniref:SAM domain-containing protein n=2 Tax=Ancylostoma ceylanicum TaxID=53326 RepID=A0A016TC25_9BILA|nr:hypothetical protein Y032_0117g681 [Ancylostoma ceylanicum]
MSTLYQSLVVIVSINDTFMILILPLQPDVAARWAQAVTGSETCAATFRREEVDGDALLMMGFDDLRSHLAFTFGPAKKLHLAIEQLKVFREQKYGTP